MKRIARINKIHLAFAMLILIYAFCYCLSQQNVFHRNKDIFSGIITFDLVVSAPLIYFLFDKENKAFQ